MTQYEDETNEEFSARCDEYEEKNMRHTLRFASGGKKIDNPRWHDKFKMI